LVFGEPDAEQCHSGVGHRLGYLQLPGQVLPDVDDVGVAAGDAKLVGRAVLLRRDADAATPGLHRSRYPAQARSAGRWRKMRADDGISTRPSAPGQASALLKLGVRQPGELHRFQLSLVSAILRTHHIPTSVPLRHHVANAFVRRSFARADEPGLVSDDHKLGAVACVQFSEDATDVGLRGERRYVERLADLGVGLAACDLGEHFPLAIA